MTRENEPFDFEGILKELEMTLSGKTIDATTRNIRVLNDNARLLNDEGVMKCMSIIRSHMNLNVCLSDFDQNFINNKCAILFEELFIVLILNKSKYDIKSYADVEIICHLVDTAIYSALMRAKNGAENKRFYASYNREVKTNVGQQQTGAITL